MKYLVFTFYDTLDGAIVADKYLGIYDCGYDDNSPINDNSTIIKAEDDQKLVDFLNSHDVEDYSFLKFILVEDEDVDMHPDYVWEDETLTPWGKFPHPI